MHKLPADLQKAINSNKGALTTWDATTRLARNEWIGWIISAKKLETRKRRIERAVEELKEGKLIPLTKYEDFEIVKLKIFAFRNKNIKHGIVAESIWKALQN